DFPDDLLHIVEVARIRLLTPDRLAFTVRLDGARIFAEGETLESFGPAPHDTLQELELRLADVDQPTDPDSAQPRPGFGSDSPKRVDGKILQEPPDPLGSDDGQAVGLFPARGDLGQELVGSYAGGGGQPRFVADARLDLACHVDAQSQIPRVLRH